MLLFVALLVTVGCLLLQRLIGPLRALIRKRRLAAKIPGPSGAPLIGVSYYVLGKRPEEWLKVMTEVIEGYGDTTRMWIGPWVFVLLKDLSDIEFFFTDPAVQSKWKYAYDFSSPHIGLGLLTSSGQAHRKHRKIVTPSLHYEILKDFLPRHRRIANMISKELDDLVAKGASVDATALMGRYSLMSFSETVLCTTQPERLMPLKNLIGGLAKSGELIMSALCKPWYQCQKLFRWSKLFPEFSATAQEMEKFATRVITDRTSTLKKQGKTSSKLAFLDRVLGENGCMEHEELLEEVKSLTFAATVTTMDFLSIFLLVLSVSQDVQQAIHKELLDVLGAERPVELEDMARLEYLERCIKETLRLYPPVPILAREGVPKEIALPSGFLLPESTHFLVVPYIQHRDPRLFPDPERFDPDRFLPDNNRKRNPFAYIPFSAGARNCVGQRYAMNSIKTVTSNLLRRFRFLPRPGGPKCIADIKLQVGITLHVVGGVWLQVERR